jgi:hypothetical protein
MDFMDFKFEDDQDKSDSKWEIYYFFEKYYVVDQKEVDKIIKKICWPKTINRHGEELYKIFINKTTGPADIADFLISLGEVYKVSISTVSTIKLKNFRDKSHTLKEWIKIFNEDFPKILNNDESFLNLFKTLFSIAFRKINDKEDSSDNSNSQNVLPSSDPFNHNFDLSAYNNQQIELNDDDQIDVDDDDDSDDEYPKVEPYTKEEDDPFHPTSQSPPEEKNKSSFDDIFNFINTTTATTNLPSPLDLPPLYSIPSELGALPPLPPIYSTSNELPPFPAPSTTYSIPSKFIIPLVPQPPNASSQDFNPNDIFSLTSTDAVDINEFEVNDDDDEDEEKNKIIFGAQYLTKEIAWLLTNLNRQYRMKKISLNSIAQQ